MARRDVLRVRRAAACPRACRRGPRACGCRSLSRDDDDAVRRRAGDDADAVARPLRACAASAGPGPTYPTSISPAKSASIERRAGVEDLASRASPARAPSRARPRRRPGPPARASGSRSSRGEPPGPPPTNSCGTRRGRRRGPRRAPRRKRAPRSTRRNESGSKSCAFAAGVRRCRSGIHYNRRPFFRSKPGRDAARGRLRERTRGGSDVRFPTGII